VFDGAADFETGLAGGLDLNNPILNLSPVYISWRVSTQMAMTLVAGPGLFVNPLA